MRNATLVDAAALERLQVYLSARLNDLWEDVEEFTTLMQHPQSSWLLEHRWLEHARIWDRAWDVLKQSEHL